jgi:hypothetical protein
MYLTAEEAYRSPTFAVQLTMTMVINFGINFGYEWAAMGQWGKVTDRSAWPRISAFRMEAPLNSCLALDLLLTTFFIGALCTAAATDGTQKEVREKKCDVLEPSAISGGWWRYTPVGIRDLRLRSVATGIYITVLVGVPTFLIAWAAVGSGSMNGYAYVWFKGVWATLVSGVVYCFVFPAAISKNNFPELEFEALMALASGVNGDAPPLIANPALI